MAKTPRNVTEILPAADGEAVKEEARRRARLGSADVITYLTHVVKDDTASTAQRVRASSMVLETAGLLQAEPKATGLFDADSRDPNGRTPS